MLTENIALNWIFEYIMFLALLVQNPEITVPSITISLIWKTHFEFYPNYLLIFSHLFKDFLKFPEDYCVHY